MLIKNSSLVSISTNTLNAINSPLGKWTTVSGTTVSGTTASGTTASGTTASGTTASGTTTVFGKYTDLISSYLTYRREDECLYFAGPKNEKIHERHYSCIDVEEEHKKFNYLHCKYGPALIVNNKVSYYFLHGYQLTKTQHALLTTNKLAHLMMFNKDLE